MSTVQTLPVGLATVSVAALHPHPNNPGIYGDTADQTLIDAIRQSNYVARLLVTTGGTIIAGHRRWDAATRLGMAAVPVEVSPLTDDLDILEVLITDNIGRVKTHEQFMKEAAGLMEIETERARRRQLATLRQGATIPVGPAAGPTGDAAETVDAASPVSKDDGIVGRAAVKVADALGVGKSKVKQATAINHAIRRLNDEGRTDEAASLRASLNDTSVNAAYALAKERGWIVTKSRPRKEHLEASDIRNSTRKLLALSHVPEVRDRFVLAVTAGDEEAQRAIMAEHAPNADIALPYVGRNGSSSRRVSLPDDVEEAAEVILAHFAPDWVASLVNLLKPARSVRVPAAPGSSVKLQIIAFLREHGATTSGVIEQEMSLPHPIVSAWLAEAQKSGEVVKTGERRGRSFVYVLAPAEEEA